MHFPKHVQRTELSIEDRFRLAEQVAHAAQLYWRNVAMSITMRYPAFGFNEAPGRERITFMGLAHVLKASSSGSTQARLEADTCTHICLLFLTISNDSSASEWALVRTNELIYAIYVDPSRIPAADLNTLRTASKILSATFRQATALAKGLVKRQRDKERKKRPAGADS